LRDMRDGAVVNFVQRLSARAPERTHTRVGEARRGLPRLTSVGSAEDIGVAVRYSNARGPNREATLDLPGTNLTTFGRENRVSATNEVLIVEQDGGVLTLTMNRPDVLNAFNDELLAALQTALSDAAVESSVRAIILTGAGRGFSAGQDLSVLQERYADGRTPSLGNHFREHYLPVVLAIRTIEKPVIAALNGVAAGAGASMALACDLRVASDKASLVEAFVRVGLIPDSGGTFILPLLVGLAKASELAFTGARVDAEEALRLGLVNRVVPADELVETTLAWAHELAALPTRAIGLTKRGFNRALMPELEELLEHEAQLMEEAGRTADHIEGVKAFLEKRKPQFTGH
jgi:2-(1,2-epoxy-1,2-dihydrophenyl)acetyl-CoA isomerase